MNASIKILLPVVAVALGFPAVSGLAQTGQEWKVSFQLVSGNKSCGAGGRGTIEVKDGVLTVFSEGMSSPNWKIQLAADGSANAVVGIVDHPTRGVRVTVPAGTGPREIQAVSERYSCVFRYIPG